MEPPGATGGAFFGAEKTAVIIEIGAAFTKCGFAGESEPRCIIPTNLKLLSGKTIPTTSLIRSDHKNDPSIWREAAELHLNKIFLQYKQKRFPLIL